MKQYFVYILKCADNSYYTGVTNNLDRRMYEHSNSFNPNSYTSKRLPFELVFYHVFYSPMQAISFEKQIKGWSRKKKEALINGNWELLHGLAECKNDSHCRGFDFAQPEKA
jgi:putative endonuclease